MNPRSTSFILTTLILNTSVMFSTYTSAQEAYHEQYRPQVHFSPKEKWINDPNGMVYYKGIYHLFFQHYPGGTKWGPMHWGHAISTDLIHWNEQPIALYPDSLGYIFSGSAVVDYTNSSGFGKSGQVPLVAIFTHSDPVGAKAKRNDFQNQSLAYSLDEGKTWTKYAANPVLKNPGIRDFRDPKVMWYEPQKKWVMTLATKDRITFFSSPDLKNWEKQSEFGTTEGAHGGVWECPDLFPMNDNGKKIWVLIVNLNPGGPNKGSATQYFIGDFDGNKFTPYNHETKWIDYGPDEYAGVTWSNTGERKLFLGWLSNWMYANLVPSVKWRNAFTIPRELKLVHAGKDLRIASLPVTELTAIESNPQRVQDITVPGVLDVREIVKNIKAPYLLKLKLKKIQNFSIEFSNDSNEKLTIGFDKQTNEYFIDRTLSGKVDFQKDFAAKHFAPRFTEDQTMDISILLDESSAELFGDDGLTVMTEIFFPATPYNQIHLQSKDPVFFTKIEYINLNSIWP